MSQLSPPERRLRWALDMGRLAFVRLRRNRAGFIAAGLSFRLLFSLIPMMAIAAVVARWSVSEAALLEAVDSLVSQTGLDSVHVQHDGGDESLGQWMRTQAKAGMAINPASLGLAGALLLAWSGLRLFDDIEAGFSYLTGGVHRRRKRDRLVIAVSLLVLLPVAATFGLQLLGHALALIPEAEGGLRWAGEVVHLIVRLGVITALAMMLYRWYPVHGPSWRAARWGGACAAVGIVAGEWGLRTYVFKALPNSPLGGAIGLVPLVMLWVYVMWLCLLYGLEMAVLIDRGRDRWQRRVTIVNDAG